MSRSKQRYVIIHGQVFRWEEKAPFVRSGRSLLGALEYDDETEALKCHQCGQRFKMLSQHIRQAHSSLGIGQYKAKHGLRMRSPLMAPRLREAHAARLRARTDPVAMKQRGIELL